MKNDPTSAKNHPMLVAGGCAELSTAMAEASPDAGALHDLHHGHLHFEGGTLVALDDLVIG